MTDRRSAPEPQGVPARRAALRLLDAVLRRALPLEAALDAAAAGLSPPDRGLARAIASETLRRLPDLDALIDSATRLPIAPDAKARMVLRIALVQALAMGTPPHAAIATALPLVDGGPRRLVHGVFGALTRRGAALPDRPTLPDPVARRWGDDWAEAARAGLAARAPLDLTLRDPAATDDWAARLGGVSLMRGQVRLPAETDVATLAGYDEGAWWVQDIAAALPARLLGSAAGTALDLCAAPGGKAMQLAAAGWAATLVEQSAARIERLRANLARARLDAAIVAADVLRWQPDGRFDAVLLDAPCSATGVFRRHPDVLHRVTPRGIAELAGIQRAMLARAAGWVRPGGRLVYAVCSLEREEGESIAAAVPPGLAPDPIAADELPSGLAPSPEGWLRIPPGALAGRGGCDGFFIARFLAREG